MTKKYFKELENFYGMKRDFQSFFRDFMRCEGISLDFKGSLEI